jgi:hypothetical protein
VNAAQAVDHLARRYGYDWPSAAIAVDLAMTEGCCRIAAGLTLRWDTGLGYYITGRTA